MPQDEGFQYFFIWVITTFLPVLYVLYCALKYALDYVLYKLTLCGLTRRLLARGWRPRRDFSLRSIRDSYMPMGIMCTPGPAARVHP